MEKEIDTLREFKKGILGEMGFTPTAAQEPIFDGFLDPYKFILITGGWRAGKSETSAALLVVGYHLDIKRPIEPRLYWIVGKDYETCREEFRKSLRYFQKLDLIDGNVDKAVHFPEEGQCTMKLRGNVEVVTRSADDEWKIAESAPNGILLVEAGRLSESIWHRIIGRLTEKRGWCILSGTLESSDPRAHPWYPNLFWEWQTKDQMGKSYAIPTWSNSVLFPVGRYDPAIIEAERTMTEDMFQEKFAAIPVRPSGLIMKEFSNEIHVGKFPYNPDSPVELAIDPGYGGAYAVVAIQIIESKPRLIGEVYLQGYVTEDIVLKCYKDFPYFDAIKSGVIDIAATQHQAMPAPIEVWQKMTHINLRCKKVEEEFGIEKLRTALKVDPVTKKPGLYVDVSCRGFIAECGGGQSPVPGGGAWLRDSLGKLVDRNNHSTKAVIYWLVDRYGYAPYMKPYAKQASLLKSVTTNGMYGR